MRLHGIMTALLLMTGLLAAAAPVQQIKLKEYIGHTWSDELVSYPLRTELAKATSLAVTDGAGKVVPYQVNAGRIYLLVTLPADGELDFTVAPGKNAAAPEHPASIAGTDDLLTLDSGVMALRLPAGKKTFSPPVDGAGVPGPLHGVRGAQGEWIGKSWLQAPLKVMGYTTTITACGPLFAEATVTYTFEGKKHYRFTARVISGQPTAILDEWMDLNPGGKYHLLSYKNDTDASTWEWWNQDDNTDMFINTSHGHPANAIFSFYDGLQPNQCRWRGASSTQPYKGVTAEGKPYSIWTYGAAEAYAPLTYEKDDAFNRIAGWWVNSLADYSYYFTMLNENKPDTPAVSLSTGRPSKNVNPNFAVPGEAWVKLVTGTNDLRIWTRKDRDLQVIAPICLGSREWLLTIQPQATLTPKGVIVKPTAYQAVRKYSFFPLEKVKDWSLDWPEPKNAWPRMFCKQGDLAEMRARYTDAPAVMQQSWIMPAAYVTGAKPEDVMKQVGTSLKSEVEMALSDDYYNSFGWFPANPMNRSAAIWEAAMTMPGLKPQDRAHIKAWGAFLAHRSWDDDYWPPKENNNGWGSINMGTMAALSRVFTASIMTGQPEDKRWLARSKGYLLGNLLPLVGDDGASISSPSYTMASIEPVLEMALVLKYSGAYDAFKENPSLRKHGQFMLDVLTPPDVRTPIGGKPANGYRCNLWTVGDTQGQLTTGMDDMLALGFAGVDEPLAGALRTMSKRMEDSAGGGWVAPALLRNRTTPLVEPDLHSRWYPNYAAFLRDGRPQETWFAYRETKFAVDHFHTDQGAFTLFAKGVPLMMDWGSLYMPYMPQGVYHNRIMWDIQEGTPRPCPGFGTDGCLYKGLPYFEHKIEPWTAKGEFFADGMSPQDCQGEVKQFSTLPVSDFLQGSQDIKVLSRQMYFPDNPVTGSVGQPAVWEKVPPFTWQRRVLFAKQQQDADPLYFLIRDDFQGACPPPTASFWLMAKDVQMTGNQAHATGQFGVDLELYAAQPAQPVWGQWQFMHESYGGEKQLCIRITQPDGKPFLTVLYPRKTAEAMPTFTTLANGDGVKIVVPGSTDYAFLAPQPVNFTDSPVSFAGTAGFLRTFTNGDACAGLNAAGKVTVAGITLETAQAAGLQITGKRFTITVDGPAQTLKLSGVQPQQITLDGKRLNSSSHNGVLTISVSAGKHAIVVE